MKLITSTALFLFLNVVSGVQGRLGEKTELDGCVSAFAHVQNDQGCFPLNPYHECAVCLEQAGFDAYHSGWYNGAFGPVKGGGARKFDLWGGAEWCDVAQADKVGELLFDYYDSHGKIKVVYELGTGYELKEVQFYVGRKILPRNVDGEFTATPAEYPYQAFFAPGTMSATFNGVGFSGPLFLTAHAVVCPSKNLAPMSGASISGASISGDQAMKVDGEDGEDGEDAFGIFDGEDGEDGEDGVDVTDGSEVENETDSNDGMGTMVAMGTSVVDTLNIGMDGEDGGDGGDAVGMADGEDGEDGDDATGVVSNNNGGENESKKDRKKGNGGSGGRNSAGNGTGGVGTTGDARDGRDGRDGRDSRNGRPAEDGEDGEDGGDANKCGGYKC